MTLQPYKHSLPTYRPIVLFSKNYLPMVRTNLKQATALLATDKIEPLNLMGKTWQTRLPGLIFEVPEPSCLQPGDSEHKTSPVARQV